MQASTNFPKVRRMLLCFSPVIKNTFGQLPRCFAGQSLLPLCLLLRPILKFWSVGATLMRFTWANHSKRWILVSNVGMTCNGFSESNTSDWLPHVWALPQNRCGLRRLHILEYATHLSCILQYSYSTFVIILFGPFARLFINLAVCIRALFLKYASIFWIVEQALGRMPLFTKWVGASSFEVILARQSRRSSTGTFSSATSGSRRISLILLHERTRRRIRLCHFCTLINIGTETAIVSFRTLPVGFPLPTISKNSLSTLFCPLILDHGVSFIISVSGPKIPVS